MLTLIGLADRADMSRDTLAIKLAELWRTVATTPAQENTLPRDSVDAAIGAEARSDWLGFDPEDNRLQLEAVLALDAVEEAQKSETRPRPRMFLVFVPEDHVTTAESFREFAAIAGADTVAFSSRRGHLAPLCDREAIGREVRGYLEQEALVRAER